MKKKALRARFVEFPTPPWREIPAIEALARHSPLELVAGTPAVIAKTSWGRNPTKSS
jgi:hypothetical protein